MAKSSYLFLILSGGLICLCFGNRSLYVSPTEPTEAGRQHIREIYSREIGVREQSNRNDGPRIAEYLRYTGLGPGYAWCAAFVSWCFREAGYPQPRSAWSPALFPSKRIIWKPRSLTKKPQTGDVFAIYYPHLKRIGHAGFIDEWGDKMVVTVEGNTSNAQQAEGVYRKRRPTSSLYAVANWF